MNEQQVIHRASATWPESKAKIVITLTKGEYHYAVRIRRFKGIVDVGGSTTNFIELTSAVQFYKKKVLETLPAN